MAKTPNKQSKTASSDINKLCKGFKTNQIVYNGYAIIYCRVSTKNQISGTSLETQKNLGKQYCTQNNFKINSVINEVCSAKSIDKQNELINIINDNDNIHLIIYEPTRISRNISDFTQLLQMKYSAAGYGM